MVAVLPHHRLDVGLPPVGEAAASSRGRTWAACHMSKVSSMTSTPEAVAGVEHRPAHRVVRAADGVEAGRLQQLDPALLGAVDGGRAERSVVVVDARAAEVDRLAVDAEAPVGRRGRGSGCRRSSSSSSMHLVAVEQRRPGSGRGTGRRRPTAAGRRTNSRRRTVTSRRRGSVVTGASSAATTAAVGVEHLDAERAAAGGRRLVAHHGRDGHDRAVVVDLGRADVEAVGRRGGPVPPASSHTFRWMPAPVYQRLSSWAGLDPDLVVAAGAEQVVDRHREPGVAVGPVAGDAPLTWTMASR